MQKLFRLSDLVLIKVAIFSALLDNFYNIDPDSMDALAQRWFMICQLADGWRCFCNVVPT